MAVAVHRQRDAGMPRQLLSHFGMNAAGRQVRDERVAERMKVGDTVIRRVGNPRRVQVEPNHLERSLRPRSRKQTLAFRF